MADHTERRSLGPIDIHRQIHSASGAGAGQLDRGELDVGLESQSTPEVEGLVGDRLEAPGPQRVGDILGVTLGGLQVGDERPRLQSLVGVFQPTGDGQGYGAPPLLGLGVQLLGLRHDGVELGHVLRVPVPEVLDHLLGLVGGFGKRCCRLLEGTEIDPGGLVGQRHRARQRPRTPHHCVSFGYHLVVSPGSGLELVDLMGGGLTPGIVERPHAAHRALGVANLVMMLKRLGEEVDDSAGAGSVGALQRLECRDRGLELLDHLCRGGERWDLDADECAGTGRCITLDRDHGSDRIEVPGATRERRGTASRPGIVAVFQQRKDLVFQPLLRLLVDPFCGEACLAQALGGVGELVEPKDGAEGVKEARGAGEDDSELGVGEKRAIQLNRLDPTETGQIGPRLAVVLCPGRPIVDVGVGPVPGSLDDGGASVPVGGERCRNAGGLGLVEVPPPLLPLGDFVLPAEGSTLVIVGDPKQSIYAFRGADVAAYLTAAESSGAEQTLTTNWRSDGPLIAGLDTLMRGVRFGDDRIPYRAVTPASGREDRRMRGSGPPVAVRLVLRDSPCRTNKDGNLSVTAARPFIARDAAAHVVDLLTTGVEILDDGGWRPTRPGDIAILCRTGNEVAITQEALAERSVPAVVGRTGSVLQSEAATHWVTLLEALEYPSSTRRVRRAALTPFIGWSPNDLLGADEDALLELHEQVTEWARILDESGVPALWKAIERATGVTERLLSGPQGERHATDLDQLTEVLHSAHRSGARSLHDWLLGEQQRAKAASEDEDTRARRLETDADAVQVLTIHSAKGLEFPIVLCPFLWNAKSNKDSVPVYHPEGSNQRVIGVGGSSWDGFGEAQQRALGESQAEEMRLFYVAVTRARHHLSLWWPACKDNEDALLARVLFGRTDDDTIKDKISLVSDDRLEQHLRRVIDRSAGTIGLTRISEEPSEVRWEPDDEPPPDLELARFDRPIDGSWRRTSFSGITAGADHPIRPTDTLGLAKLDEPEPDLEAEAAPSADLPMSAFAGGVRFGTLVHEILEQIDFTSPVLADDLIEVSARETTRRGVDVDPTDLSTALRLAIETPLFGAGDAVRLRDLSPGDLRSEMIFEMPVDGTRIGTGDMAAVLRANLSATHPLAPYADRLEQMNTARFHGFLTGAIDVIARIGDPARFWVMDYKTNRLDWAADEAAISHYSPDRMAEAMVDGDYVLQSLIYQVALHRYLRFRLDDYSIDRHLGGSLYLFVRGMIGPETPARGDERYGVARWDADPALITALDDLFTRGPAR